MIAFSLEQRHDDFWAVMHGGRRVAILFPARSYVKADVWPARQALPWSLMPDPEAFPDAACTGLPRPLSPAGNRFDSFGEVLAFLGIEQRAEAA